MLRRDSVNQSVPLKVAVEATSLGRKEQLVLEVADLTTGDWKPVPLTRLESLAGEWDRLEFSGVVESVSPELASAALERLVDEARSDMEITGVELRVAGEKTTVVRERQPFTLTIKLAAHRPVACADVWVKIVRIDGVYIFWQSSGQAGKNLVDVLGECEVEFSFDPNLFGAGEYEVTIDVGNGYDIERNFPHSQVFDRAVNAVRFTVSREWKMLNLGPLNHVFPVETRGARTSAVVPEAEHGLVKLRSEIELLTPGGEAQERPNLIRRVAATGEVVIQHASHEVRPNHARDPRVVQKRLLDERSQ